MWLPVNPELWSSVIYGLLPMWVRPLAMFMESIEIEGQPVPRFKLIQAL